MRDTDGLDSRSRLYTIGLVVVIVSSLFAGAAGSAAAADHPDDASAFIVALEDDGDATVTLRATYTLDADDERAAFADLQNDSTARTDLRDRFASRMQSVVNDTAQSVDREMAIDDRSITLSTTNGTGVAELSVHWTGLAATSDGSLSVTEPFASGFSPDRHFVIVAPEGYAIDSATPAPAATEAGTAIWDPDTSLEGFDLTLTPTADAGADGTTDDAGTTSDSAPGFGIGVAVAALLTTAIAIGRLR